MKTIRKHIVILAAVAVAGSLLSFTAPMANAADKDGVTSSRSFPKINKTKKDLLAESKSVDVESDSSWLSTTMSVPKTKSSAEQQAEAQAAQEQAAREQAAAAAAAQASAASRSQTRSATPSTAATTNTTTTTVNASSSAVVSYAGQFVGVSPYVYGGTSPTSGWDCSGFTQYVFAHFGISLPRTSGAQASVGTAVGSLADAQPGDLIANSMHVGIYAGNGMVVNALKPSVGTAYTPVQYAFSGGYSIRRVM
ncbi:C40 family peptidase [Bifidobacterium crudilactis]|jgi:cell wall-associated NlpC family hydrolase|uniref:C40 family peptidase n=1 Tax=Bifidobacterium crudilactis TaxID=327277 RepID=UPI0005521D0C|nr:C40 family peptidase [Bifidobacterium crudilactis]MCI2158649.1 C40 family peptidase [Bifidobacterium crudilactis]